MRYVVAALLAATATYALWPRAATVVVEPGVSLQDVVDDAAPGSVVAVRPGVHRGPVELSKPVHLRGEPGASIVAGGSADAAVVVAASGSRISALRVEGASTGILVQDVTGVVIDSVEVSGASLHGIEVVDASAHIISTVVNDLRDPMAQGIEVRNSDGRPDTVIERARVSGGQEGIVSHVSEVVVRDSEVANTTMRGIAITEMSDGLVSGNRVLSASGSGLYCGDMSRCAFEGNTAMDVAAGSGGRSNAGWGLVVAYHSSAWSHDNQLSGVAGVSMASMGSHMRARSPLDPASPAKLIAPMALSVAIAVAVGALAYLAARPFRRRDRAGRSGRAVVGLLTVFLVVLAIQSFHMLEHWLQVYRVHVDLIPSRGGLAGPSVESEWVHLAYNGAVMFFLAITFSEIRKVTNDARVGLLGAAVLVQGWHSIEHVAKVVQHVTTGASVNPGILGRLTDLVWFHFTINLIVYGLCVAAAILWLVHSRRPVGSTVTEPAPA